MVEHYKKVRCDVCRLGRTTDELIWRGLGNLRFLQVKHTSFIPSSKESIRVDLSIEKT